jgi:HD-GYP domain-containing protein (c-di-GMP phosphodiesterase class II)
MRAATDSLARGYPKLSAQALSGVARAADSMLTALLECPEAALALDDLSSADSYTHSHSVRVATLGMLLGQRMMSRDGWQTWEGEHSYERLEECLSNLAMGLLIHDIGKISIPAEPLTKPGTLTPEEWELMKTHPEAGASMLTGERTSPLSICVVRDHHERFDGSGYARARPAATFTCSRASPRWPTSMTP